MRSTICFYGFDSLGFQVDRVAFSGYPYDVFLFSNDLMNRMEKFLPHFCYNCGRGLAYDGAVVDVFLYITISCYKNAVYSNLDHTVENFTYSCGHSCVSVCMGWN
jgi:hypothetical protein